MSATRSAAAPPPCSMPPRTPLIGKRCSPPAALPQCRPSPAACCPPAAVPWMRRCPPTPCSCLGASGLWAIERAAPGHRQAVGHPIHRRRGPHHAAGCGLPLSQSGHPIARRRLAEDLQRGDLVRVRLDIEASTDMTWVAVNDPIPAGATILGSGLGRDSEVAAQGTTRGTAHRPPGGTNPPLWSGGRTATGPIGDYVVGRAKSASNTPCG